MTNANDSRCECKNLLTDQETWQVILDPAFCNNTGAADCLAHLLLLIKNAISSGPEGSMKAINTLQYGISMIWPYTEEYRLARELYELYLTGNLKPWDEPRRLLEGALERSRDTRTGKARKVAGRESKRKRHNSIHAAT